VQWILYLFPWSEIRIKFTQNLFAPYAPCMAWYDTMVKRKDHVDKAAIAAAHSQAFLPGTPVWAPVTSSTDRRQSSSQGIASWTRGIVEVCIIEVSWKSMQFRLTSRGMNRLFVFTGCESGSCRCRYAGCSIRRWVKVSVESIRVLPTKWKRWHSWWSRPFRLSARTRVCGWLIADLFLKQ